MRVHSAGLEDVYLGVTLLEGCDVHATDFQGKGGYDITCSRRTVVVNFQEKLDASSVSGVGRGGLLPV